jgi:hypothetical protein
MDRNTGISLADLAEDGLARTATLAAEAGTLTCSGTVHNRSLEGDAEFRPGAATEEKVGPITVANYGSPEGVASTT